MNTERPDHHPQPTWRRRRQGGPSPWRRADPGRTQDFSHLTTEDLLARHPPGQTPPLRVLDLILARFNSQHTALEKQVSHKTRHERGLLLRRFFRELKSKAGYRRIPDPRSLKQKHVRSMVNVWQRDGLAPATIQTYLSFLRGLASWIRKPGLIRPPAFYGLTPDQYERHENAQRDKSWSGAGVDPEVVLGAVAAYDARAAACLRLMRHLGLRKKESLLLKPHADVSLASATGLPALEQTAERFVHVVGKGGRPRWVPLDTPERVNALEEAQRLVSTKDAHMGDPALDLKRNLRRLEYVMEKFGITGRDLGVTGHGLRHQVMNDSYERETGTHSPVRGGTGLDRTTDRVARLHVARLAGHNRPRSAAAYVGGTRAGATAVVVAPAHTE